MKYAFEVKLAGGYHNNDSYTFTVIAANAAEACKKALREAAKDSGFKRWAIVELKRGSWVIG